MRAPCTSSGIAQCHAGLPRRGDFVVPLELVRDVRGQHGVVDLIKAVVRQERKKVMAEQVLDLVGRRFIHGSSVELEPVACELVKARPGEEHPRPPQRRARDREPAPPTARRLRRTSRRLTRRPRHRRPPTATTTRRRESPRHRLARRDPPHDPAARRPTRRRPAHTRARARQRTVKRYAPAFPS